MSRYVGGRNADGEWIQYALVYVNESEWDQVRGRVGFNREDYRELLTQFGESADFWQDVVPAAEQWVEGCWRDTHGKCFIEIEEYSPTNSHNIIDTIVVYDDGSWEHDNITTQGYGSDHLYD